MDKTYSFGRNQLIALGSAIMLAPALRLFPAASAATAGHAAWVSALAAFPPLLLFLLLLNALMERRMDGEGLAGLMLRAGGAFWGRAFLAVSALWLLLYGGFSLRAGANRLITTIYPNTTPLFFSVTLGLTGLIAALGSTRTLARFAKLTAPSVFGVLFIVLFFASFTIDPTNLAAVTVYEAPDIALGALPAVDVVACTMYCMCFSEGMAKREPGRFRSFAIWTAVMLVLLFLLSAAIIGNFGAELTARLTRPFFSLVRNLVFLGGIERIEALVVSLWVFPDFLLFTVVLAAAQQCVRLLFNYPCEYRGERFFDLGGGRYIIWLCAGATIVCAAFLGQTPEKLLRWSLELIPLINMCYAFALLPLVYLTGRLGKKI